MTDTPSLSRLDIRSRKEFSALLALCENDPERANAVLSHMEKSVAHVIGITGSPGVGKSTLIGAVLDNLLSLKRKVGVVLVDPSSPLSGGALLGDRIRMQRHATSEHCFIRSLANRGSSGGLSPCIYEVCEAFEAYGVDDLIVETVGVGQSEVQVATLADTVVVVLSPDGGDEVQLLKAGLLEVADVFVVNKSDRPSARGMLAKLRAMVASDAPMYLTSSSSREGISQLVGALGERFERISKDGTLALRRRQRRLHHARMAIRRVLDTLLPDLDGESVSEIRSKLVEKLHETVFQSPSPTRQPDGARREETKHPPMHRPIKDGM